VADALARHDPRVDVLCQLRGIGPYTAMLVFAEVGEIERFPRARHLCAWAGLTPTVRSSDGKARLGNISRQGSPHIRWALVEAAQKAAQGGGPLRAAFERIAKRRGRKIARSHSPGACSPSATTVCATARSAACKLRGRRARVPSRRRHERPSTT
jgi:transposase